MASTGLQLLGVSMGVIGLLGAVVCCALPMWRVSAFIGNNIVVAQTVWEGLWMNCVVQSTGQMQCKVYDSMLALGQDLQAARALTVVAVVAAAAALLVAIAGAKCTTCIEEEETKARVSIAAGAGFVLAGLLELVPVSWSANSVVRDFYNPLVPDSTKREIGAAMFIGWAAATLLVLGGALLCCSCPPKQRKYAAPPKGGGGGSGGGGGAPRSNYV
ncbi:claudin-4-like [Petromyzon marinus]|uniref:claudin-4-like n=1 Tax=Petromyzon marinus TaxID=7757 RepID=UPI003F6F993B